MRKISVNYWSFTLEREGYATLEAADGKTGLAMARSREPALMLLDVMLPVMDGFAVCKELERDPENRVHTRDYAYRARGGSGSRARP